MSFSISKALARIKRDVAEALSPDAIRTASRQAGHSWRERLLDPVATLHLFLLQPCRSCGGVQWRGEAIRPSGRCTTPIRRRPILVYDASFAGAPPMPNIEADGRMRRVVGRTQLEDVVQRRQGFR